MAEKSSKRSALVRKIILMVLLSVLVAIELGFRFFNDKLGLTDDIYMTLTRLIGGAACIMFMLEFSFERALHPLGNKRAIYLLAILPAFVIAINNFPFVSFFSGDCTISASFGDIIIYALFCLCVGFFEEMAFRGCALMFFLKKRANTRLGIFISILFSSLIFGIVHLINIFTSSPISVLLQIGYSALIGALCSVVLLATENIWLCVLCHGLYNFCGGLKDNFGAGIMWTTPQMIFTAIVAVIVTVYMIWLFFKIPLSNAKELFEKRKREEL